MKFKKILAGVLALGMMCAVPFLPEAVQERAVITAKADKTYKNLTYFVNYDNTVMITGHTKDIEGELVIPDEIDGMPVIAIEKSAFNTCGMTSVVLPETVTEIRGAAFNNCNKMTSINIPENTTIIGKDAFAYCTNLTSAIIPKNVTEIKAGTFLECISLSSVTIKNEECIIYNGTGTLGVVGRTAIIGYEGSTAQEYAEKYGFKFVPLSEEPDLKTGDADGSGEIDILDVITVNKAILGKENLLEEGLKAIDFNGNGKPDSDESLTILKFIVGLITDFTA